MAPICDVCEMQKASFYCEADEAYLCPECDASVHGANTLASRHKRVTFKQEQGDEDGIDEEEDNDGVCPAHNFAGSTTASSSARDFPLGAVRIGDITFARIGGGSGGSSGFPIAPGRRDEEELHQVPRFVPVAQELPSLEPFRFHALATNGRSPPARSSRFMTLLGSDAADSDEIVDQEEDGAREHQELGVVPDLIIHGNLEAAAAAKPAAAAAALPKGGPKLDKEREARVNRYREKRRTRMFSKKIRYEVRKIYAENRPRLKGRFVRRTNGEEQCLWHEDQSKN